jgi:hypothetical protein
LPDAAEWECRGQFVELFGGHEPLHPVVEHRGGGQAVDPDAVSANLVRQVLGEHPHPGLRRGIGGVRTAWLAAGRGGHRDDGPTTSLDHGGQERAHRQIYRCQVGLNDRTPLINSELGGGHRGALATGERREDLHRPERVLDRIAHVPHSYLVGDIARRRHRRTTVRRDLRDDRVDRCPVTAVHRDLHAVGRQGTAGRRSDSS